MGVVSTTTASVCTGAFLLGAAGALDSKSWTTHWEDIDLLTETLPTGAPARLRVEQHITCVLRDRHKSVSVNHVINVVALAGNGGNLARWAQLPKVLDGDGDNIVSLTGISLPGFDGVPLPIANPTVHDFADWLTEEIDNVDGPKVFFGTGIGGSIGLQAAQRAGLADAYIFHSPVGPNLDTRLLPKLMKPPIIRKAAKHIIGGPPGRILLRRRFASSLSAEAVDDFAQGYLDCDAFEVMWDILTADWFDALEPITEPTALIWGAEDGVLGSNLANDFVSVLANAEVIIEESWGHYPMLEDPISFASSISSLSKKLLS